MDLKNMKRVQKEFNQEKADAYQKLDDSVLNYYEILVSGTHTDKIEEDIKQDDRFLYWLDRATCIQVMRCQRIS